MTFEQETQFIIEHFRLFHKLYESARLIDPKEKKILQFLEGALGVREQQHNCFDFWGRNVICDNCISIRALNENRTFVKMEYTPKQIFMVTAVPVELNGRTVVVEFLKDITESIIIENKDREDAIGTEMTNLIDNLKRFSLNDALTGVYNRRFINERLPAELINAGMSEQSLAIIMADIDFFKRVNDTYGHHVGDLVLKEFSMTLTREIKRRGDWVARYGGEEFLICLPGADLDYAARKAEELRAAVEAQAITYGQETIRITASFGVAALSDARQDYEAFIEQVDRKMYQAKQNGRNRVEA